jgi:hypothetical protein
VTLEELRRRAERAMWEYESADADAEEAEDEVCLAQAAGDTALEQRCLQRATRLRDAADRAYDRMELADETLAEAEWEIENPEEAAADRAAEPERRKRQDELFGKLLRDGVITQEFYERLLDTAARM